MRVWAMVLACGLAGSAGAECLAPGQMPARVVFADGNVMDGISREGDHLHSVTHLKGDMTSTSDSVWGLFPWKSDLEGYFEQFRWKRKNLPDPASMEIGKPVRLKARRESPGGSSAFVLTVTPVGREEITVGKCSYPVLHLTMTQGTPEHPDAAVSDIWLDTERLMVWAREAKIYDRAGKLEHEVQARAVAAE